MTPRLIASGAAALAFGLAMPALAQLPPSLEVRVPKPPTVFVGDSGAAAVYELHLTNFTTNVLVLTRVEVLNGDDGSVLHVVGDSALERFLGRPGANPPPGERAKIGGGMRAIVFLWVPVETNHTPATLRHRLTVRRTESDTTPQVVEGASVSLGREIARLSPPLRGEWLAVNGPSNVSGHRRAAIGLNGTVAIGQRFAIDFVQVDDSGSTLRGDRLKNERYYAEGSTVYSVADGIVVETKDSIPENVPGPQSRAVPITLVTVGGNHIVVDIGDSRFAFYAHLKPGSLRVRPGDRVQRGQAIGLVGNSGNSTEPHLHFHLADAAALGTSTLGAEGIPYALETLEVVGRCAIVSTFPRCARGTPVTVRGAMPLQNELVRFPQ